ncbi:MAG: hypothetical protein Q7U74_15450, partial [Saprospiraceae bacterium]|nr:hypothetical protein [Saprospiraceae bacterium]
HDDCRSFLKQFRAQWQRLPNGFYACKDLTAPRKHKVFTNTYLLDQDWTGHRDCLFQLSPKEVKRLLGKPSKIEKGKNEIHNFNSLSYYYFIKDTTCNPLMEYPYIPGAYSYNRITFTFYNGKQSKLKPRLELPCESW